VRSRYTVLGAQQHTRSILARVDHLVMARGVPPSPRTITLRRRAPVGLTEAPGTPGGRGWRSLARPQAIVVRCGPFAD
jgi:hypothetical protein